MGLLEGMMRWRGIFIAAIVLASLLAATYWGAIRVLATVGIGVWVVVVSTLLSVDRCVWLIGSWSPHLLVNLKEARWLIWRGAFVVALAPVWALVCALIYAASPQTITVSDNTGLMIVGAPILFLLLVGYSMIFCGLLMRKIASRS
jgi:hypothetical protein